jgi:hypothetical protein
MAEEAASKRCPVCGKGVLTDITFRAGPNPPGVDEPLQGADSVQVETYSCGHEAAGPPLAETAAAEDLEVERRESDETTEPR